VADLVEQPAIRRGVSGLGRSHQLAPFIRDLAHPRGHPQTDCGRSPRRVPALDLAPSPRIDHLCDQAAPAHACRIHAERVAKGAAEVAAAGETDFLRND